WHKPISSSTMAHTFDEIPPHVAVMVDANIVTYALFPQTSLHVVCKELLARGIRRELTLHVTVQVAADVIHRAMVVEAANQGILLKAADAVSYLKQHPQAVRQLTRYRTI